MLTVISIFSLFVLAGCFIYLVRFLWKQYNQSKEVKRAAPHSLKRLLLRIFLVVAGFFWGILIAIFLVWLGFLKESYPLPAYLWIIGLVLTIPYLGGSVAIIWSMQYGIEYGLSTQKIRTLFQRDEEEIHSKSDAEIEEKRTTLPLKEPYEKSWKRKSEDEIVEIKKQLRRSSFDLTIPIGVLVITFFCIMYVFLRYRHPNAFEYGLFASLISFVVTLILQYFNGRSFIGQPRLKICNQCNREDYLKLKKCICGGTYEPPEFYYKESKEIIT